MQLNLDPSASGLHLGNAGACAMASMLSYADRPTVSSPVTDTQVKIWETENAIIIAFRGTKGFRDWLTDMQSWKTGIKDFQLHKGFYTAFLSVQAGIMEEMAKYPAKPVFLTGHSLGGALAMIAAFSLPLSLVHSVYTFGQPRVGNRRFADIYNFLIGRRTFRFVDQEDPIPRMPGVFVAPWIGYRHAGTEVFISSLGGYRTNPPLLYKLASDCWSIYRNRWNELLDCPADHRMENYLTRVEALT